MEKLIISYQKESGNDGTIYNQTIKTNKKIMDLFNKYIKELKEKTIKKFVLSNEDMKILYYLEELQEGKNFTTLTTLDYFKGFYIKNIYQPPKKDKDIERILLNRNTIIKVL